MNKTVLSFLAHPDDAEFICAGTLIRLRELGWSVHIASATTGDCGTTVHDRWQISAIRTAEGARAAALIGATYHCLGEGDIFITYDKPTILKAVELFRRVTPSLVFAHAQKDYMMDHEIVSMLARAASFAYGSPNVTAIPRDPESAVPHLYYCDPVEGIDPLGNPITPTTVVDISAQMPKKTEMLACHSSQREWLRAHHGTDEYLDSMRHWSCARGNLIGVEAAEAFVQHRGHAYPRNDLLAEILGARTGSFKR
ncbi:MAG TPA: PIG-L family deacetylase [Tepidisphaeraceae bacterium]|nr:PIG-L family deacetylase [Tepidisphaeraceae bacterium]